MREVCGAALFPTNDPGDEELDRWLVDNVQTQWHPVSMCLMGDDPQAVVNNRLEVNGVDGLVVADASVIPEIMCGNAQAPTVMIAKPRNRIRFAVMTFVPGRDDARLGGVKVRWSSRSVVAWRRASSSRTMWTT